MLSSIWITSNVLIVLSLAVMLSLILRRLLQQYRTRHDAEHRGRLVQALVRFTDERDAENLKQAIHAMRPSLAIDVIFEFLAMLRGDEHERIIAILVDSGLARHVVLQLRNGNEATRIHAVEMLAALPAEHGIIELSRALDNSSSREVRIAAAISLCDLGVFKPLRSVLAKIGIRGQRSRRLVELFGRYAGARIDELVAVATRENGPPFLRVAAIDALSRTGDLRLTGFFGKAADDPSGDVAAAAIRAIGVAGHPDAKVIVARAMTSKHWQVRADAADAAGKLGDPTMVEALVSLLEDDEWAVRYASGRAIRQLAQTGLETLQRLAQSTSSRSQRMASLVLQEGQIA